MAKRLDEVELTRVMARGFADLLRRIPTDYPEVYERVLARRLAKQNNKAVVEAQEPTGIKAAIYSALIIGLVVAPWFFLGNA